MNQCDQIGPFFKFGLLKFLTKVTHTIGNLEVGYFEKRFFLSKTPLAIFGQNLEKNLFIPFLLLVTLDPVMLKETE